jgi:hypothetical protein
MAIVSDIEIRLRADIAQLRNDLRRAQGEISGSINTIRKSLLTLAAGFSVAQIVNEVIRAQREFDKLNSSLITATGSTKAAGEAMKALQDFAARTPFSLQEVTEGFLKLRNLGLTPSERALESYGNTSAAMGKSLTQLVEAVADATTGEFERLKEFGIKAKQQGDQVSLTFQGTTTKIGNNAREIEEYLMRIGEVNFAGGMSRQADTLDGDLARLGDTWDQTLVAFSQSGFGSGVRSAVTTLSNALGDLQEIFKAVTVAADEEGKKVDEVNAVHFVLTTTFETLAVLGLNAAFAIKAVGRNIGAVAAALANPTQAVDILRMRFADLGEEWDKVNADSDKVLKAAANARARAAAEEGKQVEDRLAKYKIIGEETKALSDAEIKAAAKASEAYNSLLRTLNDRVDATARELAGIGALSEAEKAHLDLTRQIADGKLKLSKAQEATARSLIDEARANEVLARSNKEFDELQKQLIDNAADLSRNRQQSITSASEEAEQNEFLVQTFGMAEDAVIRLQAARLLEQEAQRLGRDLTQEEITDLERVIELKNRSAAAVANRRALEETKQFWTDIDKTAHDTFISITDGGKNAFQRLKDTAKNVFFDWLYQQTLKKWIINIGTTVGGTAGLVGTAAAAATGGGVTGSIGSLGGVASLLGSVGGIGAGAIQTAGALIGGQIGLGTTINAGIAALTSGTAAGVSAGLASIAGTLGPIALGIGGAVALLNKAFGRGPKTYADTTTIQGSFGPNGLSAAQFAEWSKKGGWFSSTKRGTDRFDLSAETTAALTTAYEAIKTSSAQYAEALGLNADSIMNRTQAIKIALGKDEAANQQAIADFFTGVADTVAGEILPNIAQFQQAGESAATTLQRVAVNFTAVEQILMALGTDSQTAFRAVGVASLEARERLVALTGGIEAFAQQATFFNENFLTQAEQIAIIQGPLNKRLEELGYAGITTTEQFKTAVQGLVSSGALATEEGAKLYAGLLAIAPQFKTVADYLQEVSDAAAETAKNAKDAADALAAQALADNEALLRAAVDSAFDAVGRAVQSQRDKISGEFEALMDRIGASIETVTGRISELTRLSDAIKGAMGTVTSDAQQIASRGAARAQVQAAIAIAKASGVLPSVDDLAGALSTLSLDSSDQFSSLADYQREVARTNNELATLGGLTDKQLTDAQRQLEVLEAQKALAERQYEDEMTRLDGILEWAQAEVDAINGVDRSVLSVVAAIATLNVAIQGLNQGATPSNPNGSNLTVEQLYRTVLGREGEKAGIEFWKKAFGDVLDADEYKQFIQGAQPELDMLDRQRRQAEAANMVTSRTMSSSSASSSAEEMKQMKTDMQRTAIAVEQLASQFNQVSGGGNSLLTEAA